MSREIHKYHYRTKSRILAKVLGLFEKNKEIFLVDIRKCAGSAFYDVVWPALTAINEDLNEDFSKMYFVKIIKRHHPVQGCEQSMIICNGDISINVNFFDVTNIYRYTVSLEKEM